MTCTPGIFLPNGCLLTLSVPRNRLFLGLHNPRCAIPGLETYTTDTYSCILAEYQDVQSISNHLLILIVSHWQLAYTINVSTSQHVVTVSMV